MAHGIGHPFERHHRRLCPPHETRAGESRCRYLTTYTYRKKRRDLKCLGMALVEVIETKCIWCRSIRLVCVFMCVYVCSISAKF